MDLLTDPDTVIDSANHGTNMARNAVAALGKLDPAAPLGSTSRSVDMVLISTVGGSAGPLYDTFFMEFGAKLGDVEDVSLTTFMATLKTGRDGVVARGKAAIDGRTMIDTVTPAVEAFDLHVGSGPLAVAGAALAAAQQGRDATIPLVTKKGRTSYLEECSAGYQGPGATSIAYLLEVLVAAVKEG